MPNRNIPSIQSKKQEYVTEQMKRSTRQRIDGCFKGLATGDAIGKQTEMLSRDEVVRWYPDGIRGFEGEPGAIIPRYIGNQKREWLIGETTDDTERTIAVARAVLRDGGVFHVTVGRELLKCEKSVHPGVKSYWEFHQGGDPARIAESHDGCGAAIRVAPVGILYASDKLERIVVGAREASIPTHGGSLAIAAAAATAAAVSGAIDGCSSDDVISLAEGAADRAQRLWPAQDGVLMSKVIRQIRNDLRKWSELPADEVASNYFPNTPLTIVPLAIALATVTASVPDAILLAANIGGDSDSVASIAGAIAGAMAPETVNDDWYSIVEQVNRHDLLSIAGDLGSLRHRPIR